MIKVTITWSKETSRLSNIALSTLDYLDQKGFYAIYASVYNKETKKVTHKKLLYIGQSFEQKIRDRLKQPHGADDCMKKEKKNEPNSDLWFRTGIITKKDQERETQQLFNDIECCMIYTSKPKCNTLCMESYEEKKIEITHVNAHARAHADDAPCRSDVT